MNIENQKYIFGEDFLLSNEASKRLYHGYAEMLPIIDYHCHLPIQQIAEDYNFKNMTDIWLRGDHYKWRALRALGVDEKFITGNASDEEKFIHWAQAVPSTIRNPLFHWTHMELKNPFGIREYLSLGNAKRIYDSCNSIIISEEFSCRKLLKHFNVAGLCTTDDPVDSLEYHDKIQNENSTIEVLPAFRPDKALEITQGENFRSYIEELSNVSGVAIYDVDSLMKALYYRISFFHSKGSRLADHGLPYIPVFELNRKEDADKTLKSILKGDDNQSLDRIDNCKGIILYELCSLYYEKGWVQQFHLGALRNINSRKVEEIGEATGFDSIGDYRQSEGLAVLLDQLERSGKLTKTIIYNLNPADNELFASIAGSFNEGPVKGKIQFGAAWWFLDQLDGMKKQLDVLSNLGILSCFVGMLTDSRSFLSYSRHEYFRRLLCDIFGSEMEEGKLPGDEKWIGQIVEDICYYNVLNYFNF